LRWRQPNSNSYSNSHGNGYSNSHTYDYSNSDRYGHGYGNPDGDCVATAAAYADGETASDATSAPITVTETIKVGTRERKLASFPLSDELVPTKEHAWITIAKAGICQLLKSRLATDCRT
jgi:hypothetical protein